MRSARVSGIFLKMAAIVIAYITYNLSVDKGRHLVAKRKKREWLECRENGWNIERKQGMGIDGERKRGVVKSMFLIFKVQVGGHLGY